MPRRRDDPNYKMGLRDAFELAALGIGATATVAAVTGGTGLLTTMIVATSFSAAYLLKR